LVQGDPVGESQGTNTVGVADATGFAARVGALREAFQVADTLLGDIPRLLEGARVGDGEFGRLFDAHTIKDAYHARLPATETNVDQARAVLRRYVT
jgi:hypothetical protein